MENIKTGFIIFAVVYLIVCLSFIIRSDKTVKIILFSLLNAVWLFLIVNFTTFYTGFHIPLNYGTAGILTFLGAPGGILIYVINLII